MRRCLSVGVVVFLGCIVHIQKNEFENEHMGGKDTQYDMQWFSIHGYNKVCSSLKRDLPIV